MPLLPSAATPQRYCRLVLADVRAGAMQVSYVSRPKSTNECRKVIEPGAPALATTRIDAASLDAPTRTHQAHAHPARPGGTRSEDLAFHVGIVAATGNRILQSLPASVTQRTARAASGGPWSSPMCSHGPTNSTSTSTGPCAPTTASPPSPQPTGMSTTWTPGYVTEEQP